ncbi:serine/threonine-protein kinase [Kitasatospora sp. DSM 101779]|uniref:serine/threonine-protein kinase n=1 Tax=Kitasatospora sp. DSM 101779 TaxID=2853165 RepID=UPI0021DAF397|nr:serine/threonine-protein kinase [Kitasatospora sp. DSM 101779]MCU7822118.1 protein kinase [Kitasatospora sp. DSM 101779]
MQGQLLGERYELLERLDPTGSAERWRAYDRQLGVPVEAAVLAGPGTAPEETARLAEAARAAAERPEHPHLVTVLDAGTDPASGTVYAVLEQVDGRTLEDVLAADGVPGTARAAEWTRQICAGLAASHTAGAVHRDLRPAHLLLTADGTVRLPGLAVDAPPGAGQPGIGPAGALAAVPWMSPELVRGAEQVDARSDLYAVGCLLYQLLTGKPPFAHREPTVQFGAHLREAPAPPSRRGPGVTPGLDQLVLRLLAKAPEERPVSADEVLAELDALAPEIAAVGGGPAGPAATGAHEPTAHPVAGFPAGASFAPAAQPPAPVLSDFDTWEEERRTSWWQGSAGRRAGLVAGSAALALALVSGITWAVSSQGGAGDGGPKAAGTSAKAVPTYGDAGSAGDAPVENTTGTGPSAAAPGSAAASAAAGTSGTPGAAPGAPADPSGSQPGATTAPGTAPATPGTPTTAGPTKVPPSPATSAGTYGCSGGLVGSYPVTTASGVVFGYFYIWFDSASGKNCAATIKTVNSGYGTASAVSASISRCSQTTAAASCSQVAGTTATDQGNFAKYAGPVRVSAVKTCINGSGSITWAGQSATTRSLGNRAVHCG